MSVGHDGQPETGSAPKVLTSVPWVVVLLGVGLLTTLLLFTLLSLRGPERQAAPPPAPPMYLPVAPSTTASAAPSDGPLVAVDRTDSPSTPSSPSKSPLPRASSAGPSTSSSGVATAARAGTVAARYQVTQSDRNAFEARLTVTNGSAESQSWQVELLFNGNVKSIQASSSSGVSVSNQGGGSFVLKSAGPLGSGQTATVQMRFTRTGTGDRPSRCTVNGAACSIA